MENISDSKLLPYGMMNFAVIRRDDYYYVDKTAFIPLIERSDRFFFFMRPRRFGKSLTLNMLQHYYDVNARDKFDALFGDLYIGQHPTKDRNSYLVLKLNFSLVSSELHNYLYSAFRRGGACPSRCIKPYRLHKPCKSSTTLA